MPNINMVVLAGHMTRDAELKTLDSGMAVCNFGLAINRKFKTAGGEDREEVTFIDCEAWGKTAENLTRFFSKGSAIFLTGRLKLDQWESEGGEKRSKVKVVVNEWQFVEKKTEGQKPGGEVELKPTARSQRAPAQPDDDDIPF